MTHIDIAGHGTERRLRVVEIAGDVAGHDDGVGTADNVVLMWEMKVELRTGGTEQIRCALDVSETEN